MPPNPPPPRVRPALLGQMSQRAVVEALKTGGPMSRADLSRQTGISPPTVSAAIAQVIRAGLVEEAEGAGPAGGKPGRTGRPVRLSTATAQVIGVSVEPDWCDLQAGGLDGRPQPKRHARFPTPNTYPRLLAEVDRHVGRWAAAGCRTLAVGLSLPGLVDPAGGAAVFSPNLHQTDGQHVGRDLAARLGRPVVLLHENDALCLAERRVHATDDLAVLDYAGGLGWGVLVGGRLLARDLGLPQEVGHLPAVPDGLPCGCGNRGCLETVACDAAFARRLSAAAGRPLTVEEALAAARHDRAGTAAAVDSFLHYLGLALAAVVNLFAPPLLVLSGRLLGLDPTLYGRLAARADAHIMPPLRGRARLVPGTASKAEGAMAGAVDHLFEGVGPAL